MNLAKFASDCDIAKTFNDFFFLEKISASHNLKSFDCSTKEYNDFLKNDAILYQNKNVSFIYVLGEKKTGSILAYMSLGADSVTITDSEKKISSLTDLPYRIFPAMKITKLAVCKNAKKKYQNIGSFMIMTAYRFAFQCNKTLFSCRFVTVDADIENNPSVEEFYKKNGFSPLAEKNYKRKTQMTPMYADPF